MLERISTATDRSYWCAPAFSSALSVANSMKHKQEEAHAHCFLLISLYVFSVHIILHTSITGSNSSWNEYVFRRAKVWKEFFSGWVLNTAGQRLLVVRYEDLLEDTITELRRILHFLKVPFSKEHMFAESEEKRF